MTPEKILDALNDLDGQIIREARAEKTHRSMGGRRVTVLIAAVVALMAMTVTAFASEAVAGWFRQFFAGKVQAELTPGQIEFIEENEQIIAETKEENGWTVEMKSILSNGNLTYITLGLKAPANVSLEENKLYFGKGIEIWDEGGNPPFSYSFQSQDDQDGMVNTVNLVMTLGCGDWNVGTTWNIQIDGLYTEVYDAAYEQELLQTKYAGQSDVMFTGEETAKIYQHPMLTDGKWSFIADLSEVHVENVELINEPVTAFAHVWDTGDPKDITDGEEVYKKVSITSFILNPLSATIECNEATARFGEMYVVMKDGTEILMQETYGTIKTESPVVLDEVDHIILADGTKIPMPE